MVTDHSGLYQGGIMITTYGYTALFVVNFLSFVVSAFLESGIQFNTNGIKQSEEKTSSFRKSLFDGIYWIMRDKCIQRLFWAQVFFTFALSPMAILIPVYAKTEQLGSAKLYSLLLSLIGIGGIIASVLIIFNRRSIKDWVG